MKIEDIELERAKIRIYIEKDGQLPMKMSKGSVGYDIFISKSKFIMSESFDVLSTSIFIEIEPGWNIDIRLRSGIPVKKGLIMPHGVGTIDWDYRGEILIPVYNPTKHTIRLQKGDRIAQMIVRKVYGADFEIIKSKDDLSRTKRSTGGFGHTGR